MNKIIHPLDVKKEYSKYFRKVFCHIQIKEGKLSITGVEGPKSNGNCFGSCGQIDMDYKTYSKDNYTQVLTAKGIVRKDIYNGKGYKSFDEIRFTPGWNFKLFTKFLDVWDKWHLNDMRAECEHQRNLNWTYETHHGVWEEKFIPNPKNLIDEYADGLDGEIIPYFNKYKGHSCPVCNYSIGSKWLFEPVPDEVIDFLNSLPDTDIIPAWV